MLRLPRHLLEQTLAHLRAGLPREGVGLWVGRRGRVAGVVPLENVDPEPLLRYQADPLALLRAVRGAEAAGLELVAIYHSHPRGPARPSQADRAEAFWRVPYVIFAPETGELRAYRLPQGEEVAVLVEGRLATGHEL